MQQRAFRHSYTRVDHPNGKMACHLRQILASPLFFANYVLHAAIHYPSSDIRGDIL
ncbi:EC1118_1O4_3796p [Saccharomyces cerevisiae EC1118]|uniref:EC1118_1O4_3796p n=1 Tax=Saccharomyces cerevisiae (strain Lalvin EC1118 / Prise de mousse) TaxID=643680 RepID=C8ZGS2_YEAS8|nr:EC1118_1O4_3796p [Saccharomyces cerevisiae EC1118]